MLILNRIFSVPLYSHVNRALKLIAIVKTRCWYAIFFKHIGKGTVIYKPTFISNPQYISIGRNVCIRAGVRLEAVLDGVNTPDLRIGNNTNIEQNVHIVCHNSVSIGDNVSITANCAIVDTTHPYFPLDMTSKIGARISQTTSNVKIEDNCFLGIGSIILPNTNIGQHAYIGANSVVSGQIQQSSVVRGTPAKVVKIYDDTHEQWISANE